MKGKELVKKNKEYLFHMENGIRIPSAASKLANSTSIFKKDSPFYRLAWTLYINELRKENIEKPNSN